MRRIFFKSAMIFWGLVIIVQAINPGERMNQTEGCAHESHLYHECRDSAGNSLTSGVLRVSIWDTTVISDQFRIMEAAKGLEGNIIVDIIAPKAADAVFAAYDSRGKRVGPVMKLRISPGISRLIWHAGDAFEHCNIVRIKAEAYDHAARLHGQTNSNHT